MGTPTQVSGRRMGIFQYWSDHFRLALNLNQPCYKPDNRSAGWTRSLSTYSLLQPQSYRAPGLTGEVCQREMESSAPMLQNSFKHSFSTWLRGYNSRSCWQGVNFSLNIFNHKLWNLFITEYQTVSRTPLFFTWGFYSPLYLIQTWTRRR